MVGGSWKEPIQHEPSLWLREALTDRFVELHLLDVALGLRDLEDQPMQVVMMTLTEPPEEAEYEDYERWEHSCDRCGVFSPGDFHSKTLQFRLGRGMLVVVVMGLCPECNEKELG